MKKTLWICGSLALTVWTSSAVPPIVVTAVGTYATGVSGATEIAAFDPASKRLFSVNGVVNALEIIDLSDPRTPRLLSSVAVCACAPGRPTSVAARDGIVAVAVENFVDAQPGRVAFFSTEGVCLNAVDVGAGPDMVTYTANGRHLLVANEGEAGIGGDPAGSVAIIDVSRGPRNVTPSDITLVTFDGFDKATLDSRIHHINPSPAVPLSIDLEPEYIAVSDDSRTAWVTLEENNALAVLDIQSRRFTHLHALGFKDYRLAANALDASDQDGGIHISNWPIFGMYQPDSIAALTYRGGTFLLTANEGDSSSAEETRVAREALDPTRFPNAGILQAPENIGRLHITRLRGDADHDGDFDELYAFGGRSFSIWSSTGDLVFDSGNTFERVTAAVLPKMFNSNGDNPATFDIRSADQGPEPEGLIVGEAFGRRYVFVGLERVGGIMIFDVTNPYKPVFVKYVNTYAISTQTAQKDVGPEGLMFVKAEESPNGKALLIVSNEISGTITIFEVGSMTMASLPVWPARARISSAGATSVIH
jgi:hypothetical protein